MKNHIVIRLEEKSEYREVETFDKQFPYKEKKKLPGQIF